MPREALILASAAEIYGIPTSPDPFAAGPWRLLGATTIDYRGDHSVEVERAGPARSASQLEGEKSLVEVAPTETATSAPSSTRNRRGTVS